MSNNKKYMLREAAGSYWLVNISQTEKEYERPLALNETGALIWKEQNKGREKIAEIIADEYGIKKEDALRDINEFIEMHKDIIDC